MTLLLASLGARALLDAAVIATTAAVAIWRYT